MWHITANYQSFIICSYSDTLQFVVFYLSQWRVNSYKSLYGTIFWTNFHLTEEYVYTAIYIRWLCVDVNVVTVIVPPSTVIVSCTVTAPVVIIIIWSAEFHIITYIPASARHKPITTYSSKPSNMQSVGTLHWHFLH